MKKYLLAAVAIGAIASPAAARDGSGYFGVEAGVAWVKDQNADIFVDYSATQAPLTVPLAPVPADTAFNNVFGLDSKMGYDIGIFGGYDFGGFRIEGEIDWKHANLDNLDIDSDFIDAINDIDDDPFFDDEDLDLDEAVGALSFMINGLVDFGDDDGLSFQAGVGAGWAKVKMIDEKDGAFAWQAILGMNYAISPSIDLGLRYKYFSTGSLDFGDEDVAFASFTGSRGVQVIPPGGGVPQDTIQTITADVYTDVDAKFRSHSLVATLTFNFGAAEPPPPPPPEPERG